MNEFQKAMDIEIQQAYADRLREQLRPNSFIQAMVEDQQRQWNALPWYTKRWKRFKGWVYWTRRSVGEWIAGEKFSNDY